MEGAAVDALTLAEFAGVKVTADDSDLAVEASAPPPPELLSLLKRLKVQILRLIAAGDFLTNEDLVENFRERAAILEFEAGLSRIAAERRAVALLCRASESRLPILAEPRIQE